MAPPDGWGAHPENGVRQGTLDAPDAQGTAEMRDRRLRLFEVAFNRVLGLEDHAASPSGDR